MIKTIYIVKYVPSRLPHPVKDYINNFYNIGFCENIDNKIRFLQDNSPFEVQLVWENKCFYFKEVKKWFQRILTPYYHKSNWYLLPPDKVMAILKGIDKKIVEMNSQYLLENRHKIR